MANGIRKKRCTILENNRSAERPFEKAGISSKYPLKDKPDYIFKKVQIMENEIANGCGVLITNYSLSTKRVQMSHLRGYIEFQLENDLHYCVKSLEMLKNILDELESLTWKRFLNYSKI